MIRILPALIAGVALIAACAPAPAANPNAPPGGYHIVRADESYDAIAAQHGVETAALFDLNRITPATPLRVGQPLALPAPSRPLQNQPFVSPEVGKATVANPLQPTSTSAANRAPAGIASTTVASTAANPPGSVATANAAPANPGAPEVANVVPATPDTALDVRPAPPTPFSAEWRDVQLARVSALVDQGRQLYTDVRGSPGGIFIIGGVAIVAGFLLLQVLIWLGREIVVALLPLGRRLGFVGHEFVLNVWYAAWWAGLAVYVPSRAAWKVVQPWAEPRARALGRYALEHGTSWSRRAAAWVQAAALRTAIAARDEAIDALAELALTRPALRGISDRLQEMAYHRDRHAMRTRVPGAAISAWPPPEEELLEALASGALTLEFTPILDVAQVTVAALDASLRWERHDGSIVTESRLNTAIERPGYTRVQRAALTYVLSEVCARAASGPGGESAPMIVATLGRAQFSDPTLFSSLRTALEQSGVDASNIELCVDERVVLADLVAAGEILGRLAELGVRTSIREFGALTDVQLAALNVHGVTVDFWNSRRDERIERYVAESVRTAHQLNLPVTATRAETPDEVEFARTLQCERLASPPAPEYEAPPLMPAQSLDVEVPEAAIAAA